MPPEYHYSQYQCTECGFRTRSPDEEEVVGIVERHIESKHGRSADLDEIRSQLTELELEGLPDR